MDFLINRSLQVSKVFFWDAMILHEPVEEIVPTHMWLLSCSKSIPALLCKVFILCVVGSMGKVGVVQLMGELVLLKEEFMDLLVFLVCSSFIWMMRPEDP